MPAGYEFDSYRLDPVRRTLTRDGEPVAITPKVFDLLLYLVERHGRIVQKEELLAAVWPNIAIIDANLSQSIFVLRKALGESAKTHRFIVTTPGRGYSFVGDVCELAEEVNADSASDSRRSGVFWRRLAVAAAAVAVFSVLAFYLGSTVSGGSAIAPLVAVPLATLPGGQYEPAFSPDGASVAFVWSGEKQDNFDIYVMSVPGGNPRRLTTDPAGDGSPSWSPDGRSIAFLRYSEKPLVSGVYVRPMPNGPERKIAEVFPIAQLFDRHIDWSPKGNQLAVVDKDSGDGSFRIDLISPATGARQRLTKPPQGSIGDTGPQFSPDGRFIAFRRTTSSSVNELFIVPVLPGAEARRITSDNAFISGHAWAPDGRDIVMASTRNGSKGLWRVSVATGAVKPMPGVGEQAYFLALSRQKNRLAYSTWSVDTNIWRATVAPKGDESTEPVEVIASTLEDLSPQYSPDGRRIAFRSNRSGSDEIWVADADGRNPVRLTSFRGPLTGTPRWSPDGSAIAFDSRPVGNSDIYVVAATGGATRRITTSPADDVVPSWSGDGKWIYFGSNRTGSWQVWKAPAQGEANGGVQLTRNGGFAAFESRDGKWVYYAKGVDVAGLWRTPSAGGAEEPVIPELTAEYWGYWAIGRAGIYFLDPLPSAGSAVKFYSFESQEVSTVRTLAKAPPYGDSGLTIAPDGKSILYPQADHSISNLMLVENFR
jgi:Tol biopolymer transport system component/DNA-binding winged helix-turn-helix (wHTH) protein